MLDGYLLLAAAVEAMAEVEAVALEVMLQQQDKL